MPTPSLAGLGQDVGEVLGQMDVVLELVHVGEDRVAALGGHSHPAEGGLPEH